MHIRLNGLAAAIGATLLALPLTSCSLSRTPPIAQHRILDIDELTLNCDCQRLNGASQETLLFLGEIRNASSRIQYLCRRFEIYASYEPSDSVRKHWNVYYLIPDPFPSGGIARDGCLNCEPTQLGPGTAICDTIVSTIRPDDFLDAPGFLRVNAVFWVSPLENGPPVLNLQDQHRVSCPRVPVP